MKKRIKHLWNKTAEPRTERLLLIFLPFLTLVLVAPVSYTHLTLPTICSV